MDVQTCLLKPTTTVPNNPRFALLHYQQAVKLEGEDPAAVFERLFEAHGWGGSWRNGIFAFHHYHATAHEVLGLFSGEVTVCFGGAGGVEVEARAGDVIVVPAGVAHRRVNGQGSLGVVGAYPVGQSPDLCRAGHNAASDAEKVARVGRPPLDPVCGATGPLMDHWPSD